MALISTHQVLVNGGAGTVPRGATPHATYLPPEQQMVVRGPGPSPPNSAAGKCRLLAGRGAGSWMIIPKELLSLPGDNLGATSRL